MKIFVPKNTEEIKGLPDEFYYEYYQELSNERDLSRWGVEFVSRQEGMDKEKLLNITGGIKYKNGVNDIKTQWRNGVLVNDSLDTHACMEYLNDRVKIYLSEAKAIFVPDDEKNKYQNKISKYKINSTVSTPESKKYKKLGRTYFKTRDGYMDYIKKSNILSNTTASFLINLKMPTSAIIKELETNINLIKSKKNISEIDTTKYNKFNQWAMGLACFDLLKGGVKKSTIKSKYLSFCYDGSQKSDILGLDNQDHNRWKNTYNPVVEMINGGWKNLVGNPD